MEDRLDSTGRRIQRPEEGAKGEMGYRNKGELHVCPSAFSIKTQPQYETEPAVRQPQSSPAALV